MFKPQKSLIDQPSYVCLQVFRFYFLYICVIFPLSSACAVVHRNVGSESHMVNFARDGLFKLDDVGMRNITKYFQHMSTWVLNYVLQCLRMLRMTKTRSMQCWI